MDKNVGFNAEGDGLIRKLTKELPKADFNVKKCEKLVLITHMRPRLHSFHVRVPFN